MASPASPAASSSAPRRVAVAPSGPLPGRLNTKGAARVKRLLSGPEFAFLGRWRSNESLLLGLNEQLLRGGVGIIDGFLADETAADVYQDTVRGAELGWLRAVGTADVDELRRQGVDANDLKSSADAGKRCEALHALDARIGFKFRYHLLDPRGRAANVKAGDFPGHLRVIMGLSLARWTQALVVLLTGSQLQRDSAEFEVPYFREYSAGDYATLHNDLDGGAMSRALCFNYWMVSEGWDTRHGGGFLWCGPRAENGTFPAATSVAPRFNTASIFAPSASSWHAVGLVEAPPRQQRRFSFTSWLRAPRSPVAGSAAAGSPGGVAPAQQPGSSEGPGCCGKPGSTREL